MNLILHILRICFICIFCATYAVNAKCNNDTCLNCNRNGICEQCRDGYYIDHNQCSPCSRNCTTCRDGSLCEVCNIGYYQYAYSQNVKYCAQCHKTCSKCVSPYFCSECIDGFFGTMCSHNCTVCINNECSKDKCTHGCTDGYYYVRKDKTHQCLTCNLGCKTCSNATLCESCEYGRWGSYCEYTCQAGCKDNVCHISTGACERGCKVNYYRFSDNKCYPCSRSSDLCSDCKHGTYRSGNTCIQCPPHCKDSACNVSNGMCDNGCENGGTGPECTSECLERCLKCEQNLQICTQCKYSYYGKHCEKNCSKTCLDRADMSICEKISGNCLLGCKDGYWGKTCEEECTRSCFYKTCTRTDGHCVQCDPMSYGPFCGQKCSDFCHNPGDGSPVCKSDGQCLHGCKSGICSNSNDTNEADETMSDKASGGEQRTAGNQVVTIAGAAGGVVLMLILTGILVFVCIIRRKKSSTRTSGETTSSAPPYENNPDKSYIYTVPYKVKKTTEDTTVSIEITGPSGQLHAVPQQSIRLSSPYVQDTNANVDNVLEEIDDESTTAENLNVEPTNPHTDTYYNIAGLKRSRIQIERLLDYVDKKTDFEKEFQKFPKGLARPYIDASKPSNVSKNRYKGIYPYDISRVRLGDGSTDFINASYIDGYNKPNAYIASLGPTSKHMGNFVTFWRMVWQEKVEKIVMLTNLVEVGKMKCDQYWPDPGLSITYGEVTVICERDDLYAEYAVRLFNVSKFQVQRTLYQIHFTAWPDNTVPDTVTSLIEFRQTVESIQTGLGGPIIVHCSAGIGRTGTYIALDSLTAEGEAEKSVDIFGCVMGMRGQRVNMVQNEIQYEYLHNAVVHSLIFDCQPIKSNEFQDHVSSNTEQLMTQYKIVETSVNRKPEVEIDAIAKHIHYREKNRKGAAIPGNRYRPLIMVPKKTGSSNYINAVFINSFSRKNRFIAAQTPLPGTVTDFLLMVTQQRVSCIVSLDEENIHDKTVVTYLPAANQVLKHGSFHISCKKSQSTSQYILRTLVISHHEKGQSEEYTVAHFQFTQWKKYQPVPTDPTAFLQLVKDVEKADAANELTGPLAIHCLTGGERSCLFCVVSVLIQKMEIEQKVSVVNTVRQVRSRRGNAIPNMEQYIFSHQCLCSYLNTENVYANVSVLV